MKQTTVEISDFYCTCCGKKGVPLPRKERKKKEPGHLKKIYCINCKEQKNFVEIKPFGQYTLEIFQTEFENDNFDEEGNRKEPYKQFLAKLRKETEK